MGDSTPENPKKRSRSRTEFPLWQHEQTGYWCKTIAGRRCYFGKTAGDEDGRQARKLWLAEKDYLYAGELPPTRIDYVGIGDICDEDLRNILHAAARAGPVACVYLRPQFATMDRVEAAWERVDGWLRLLYGRASAVERARAYEVWRAIREDMDEVKTAILFARDHYNSDDCR